MKSREPNPKSKGHQGTNAKPLEILYPPSPQTKRNRIVPDRSFLLLLCCYEVRDFWMCVNLLCVTLLPFGGRVLASRIAALKNHEEAKLILSRNPSFLLCLTLLNSKVF